MKKICTATLLLLAGCGSDPEVRTVTNTVYQNVPGTSNNGGDVVQSQINFPYSCGDESFTSDLFTVNQRILNQNGWVSNDLGGSTAANFDEKVVNLGSDACRGSGAWYLNNSVISGGFDNQPVSPNLNVTAGESSVRSVGGGDTIEVSFYIKTVANVADGSAFTLSVSPQAADRQTYVRFVNNDDGAKGFNIYGLDGVNLDKVHDVGKNLSRNTWHHIRMVTIHADGQNTDGSGNDLTILYLDGKLIILMSTWEAWRTSIPATTLAVSRVLFRMSALPSSIQSYFNASQGFYIDDFKQKIYNINNPNVILSEYSTGFEPI